MLLLFNAPKLPDELLLPWHYFTTNKRTVHSYLTSIGR